MAKPERDEEFEREFSDEPEELLEFARIAFYSDYDASAKHRRQLTPDEIKRILTKVQNFEEVQRGET